LEWAVLGWNAPAIAFYDPLRARPQDKWTLYRLTGETLAKAAREGARPGTPGRASSSARACPGRSALLGLPEDLVDFGDLREQLVGDLDVHGRLGAGGPGQLGGLVEQLVQLRVLLEVGRLEVVGPQHPQVLLDQLGALLLDQNRPGAELGVLVGRVLLGDRLDRLGPDPGLRRVVDATRQVAVRGDLGLRAQKLEQHLRIPSLVADHAQVTDITLVPPGTSGQGARYFGLRPGPRRGPEPFQQAS